MLETTLADTVRAGFVQLTVNGGADVSFDDMLWGALDPESHTMTHNDANELTSVTTAQGTINYTYDDWGRQTRKTLGSYQTDYTWRYGHKLSQVTSNFPGEVSQMNYLYDALGKRRNAITNLAGADVYRYDLGWNAIAQYDDDIAPLDYDVGTRDESYTLLGMTPLAQIAGSNPAASDAGYPVPWQYPSSVSAPGQWV